MQGEQRENFFIELLKFFLISLAIVVPIRLWIAQPFIVSGASMEPTFDTGQYLVIDELSYHFTQPQRGEVVVFRYPLDPSEFFIKRVIGLPGEVVHIGGTITVTEPNGGVHVFQEPYVKNIGNGLPQTVALGPDQYFVMGDNRPDSSDSRVWGPVPRANIVGRAFVRLLPVSQLSLWPGSFELSTAATTTASHPK